MGEVTPAEELRLVSAQRDEMFDRIGDLQVERDRYRAALEAISADSAPNLVNPSADIAREALEGGHGD